MILKFNTELEFIQFTIINCTLFVLFFLTGCQLGIIDIGNEIVILIVDNDIEIQHCY